MALLDGIRRQLRSVIEWINPDPDILFCRWSDDGDEIKDASRLIVGPGQGCIFIYEGKVRALFATPGLYDLKTANIPFWTTVTKFMQFFESEHKVSIFFFRTTQILNQKWGTTSTIKYEDPKYKFPVGLKTFGNYSFQIANPRDFYVNIVGGEEIYTVSHFRAIMVNRLLQPLTDYLAGSQYTYTEIDSHREEIAQDLLTKLIPEFDILGFRLLDYRIEGTDFDDSTLKRINRIADVTAEAHAATAAGLSYKEMQQLEALRDAAARNESGAAGAGVGIGAGIGLGKAMSAQMADNTQTQSVPKKDISETLRDLKNLFDNKLITEMEYAAKKKELLDQM